MAERNQSSDQSTGNADRPATTQTAKRSSVPAVFGDGSTKEQQDAQVKAAQEADRSVKEYADAERESRSS